MKCAPGSSKFLRPMGVSPYGSPSVSPPASSGGSGRSGISQLFWRSITLGTWQSCVMIEIPSMSSGRGRGILCKHSYSGLWRMIGWKSFFGFWHGAARRGAARRGLLLQPKTIHCCQAIRPTFGFWFPNLSLSVIPGMWQGKGKFIGGAAWSHDDVGGVLGFQFCLPLLKVGGGVFSSFLSSLLKICS
jgi:hypothetical protein